VKPVDLNFSASPFRNNTPFYIGYALGALVLIAFTTYNTWAFVHYSRGNTTLGETYAANRAKLESLRREATDLQARIDKIDLGSMNSRAAFTNGLLERRRFSWTDLLNSLEEAQVYQVRLLSLLPRIQEKGIIIDARAVAHDLKSMWNFQQNLQIHPKFRRVYPGGWTKSTEQGEIVFNLAFNYFPQGAPEGAQGPTPQEAGLPGFVEAPGTDESAEDAANTDDLPAEEPPAVSKKPSRTAGANPAPAPPAAAAPPPSVRSSFGSVPPARPADPAGANRNEAIPGTAPADSAKLAADPGAPGGAAAANPSAVARPSLAGIPTVAPQPTGPAGATGATGTRRLGRGLPPGSHGVRPTPPPKTSAPTLPVAPPPGGSNDDDEGDDE